MANTWATTPLSGCSLELKTTDPLVGVGTVVMVNSTIPFRQGKFAMYIKASGIIGNSSCVTVDLSTISCLGSSVDSAGTGTVGFRNGSVAFAANEYGWVYCVQTMIPHTAGTNS